MSCCALISPHKTLRDACSMKASGAFAVAKDVNVPYVASPIAVTNSASASLSI